MWNESDRIGFKKFAGHDIENSLFLRQEGTNLGSVWYSIEELDTVNKKIAERINENPNLFIEILGVLDKHWNHIEPLIAGRRKLKTIEELSTYYSHLVEWWSAMTVVFNIAENEKVDQDIKSQAFMRRVLTEKFSDTM